MTYEDVNRVSTAKDMWGKTLTMTYDAVGNRTVLEDSEGGVTTSTYDGTNQLTQRKFDDGTTELRLDFTYTDAGQIDTITRYSDLSANTTVAYTTYTYDGLNRISNLHTENASSTDIANFTFVYDDAGRLSTMELDGTTTTYAYDDSDQLTGDGANTFTYDGTGNRNNGSYSTGTGDRLITDGTWTFSYDHEGNIVKMSKGENDETWTYGYDHRNQLTWVEQRETYGGTLMMRADYAYDVFGNRIEKQVDEDGNSTVDLTERYSYDGWKPGSGFVGNENWDIWADLDDSSSLTTRYIRGNAIDQIFARIDSSNNVAHYFVDHLGTIRHQTNGSGALQNTIAYDGFGNITSETDLNYTGRYTFTGRERDVETQLYYYKARYYNANIGRWTSEDPLGYEAGDVNLFRYGATRSRRCICDAFFH